MADLYATVKGEVEAIQGLVVTQKKEVPQIDLSKSVEKGDLLDEINGRLAGATSSGSGARKQPQEVASFAPFLTRGDVSKLRSDAGEYVKLEVVAARASSLGLFRPSEQSFKAGVCIGILCMYEKHCMG